MQNPPYPPDWKFQRVAIRQGRINVPEVRPIQSFLKKITLQQLGKNRQKIVTLATNIKTNRQAEPPAFDRRKLAVPPRRVGLINSVADMVIHTHPPAQTFQAGYHLAAKLMPKRIDRHPTWIRKPAVARCFLTRVARFEVDEKPPGRVRLQGRKTRINQLLRVDIFCRDIMLKDDPSTIGQHHLARPARHGSAQRTTMTIVIHPRLGKNPFRSVCLAQRLQQEPRSLVSGLTVDMQLEDRRRRNARQACR